MKKQTKIGSLPNITLRQNIQQKLKQSLQHSIPILSTREIISQMPTSFVKTKTLFSSPFMEKSHKNLVILKKMKITNQQYSSSQSQSQLRNRIQSGKQRKPILPELAVLKVNLDKKTYLKQPMIKETLVGQQAIQKFYKRYKSLDRKKQEQEFFNEKNVLTKIISLLEMHNFTPRKLTIVKLKGSAAILDLKKFGLGQSNLGHVVSQLMSLLDIFEEVDLSYNRIDPILAETLVQKLKRIKRINLSHNKIGKIGCEKFSTLFLSTQNRIQELNLQENGLLDNAGAILIQNLLKSKNLKKLNLNKNYLGLKFAQELKSFLQGGDKQLSELYLSWNQFSEKAVKLIFEAIPENFYLRVFDFSWNKIWEDNVVHLTKILEQSTNIVHMDLSFCQIKLKSIPKIAAALANNHTLYGLHFEGNSGFIDHKGFLVSTQKEFHQYPLPLIKGLIRKLDGVKPTPSNDYIVSNMRDICWICQCWQEKYFEFKITENIKEKLKELNIQKFQMFIHFKHQNYAGTKMHHNIESNIYQIYRMLPVSNLQFFFTIFPSPRIRPTFASQSYEIIQEQLKINYYIGKIQTKETIKARNITPCSYQTNPVNEDYDAMVNLVPRNPQVKYPMNQGILIKKKRKVLRQQKVKVTFKDVDNEDSEFMRDKLNRDLDEQFIKKCIQFDIKNSKIPKIIKDPNQIQQLKKLLLKYYRAFKDTFYYLAHHYPNMQNIYSINEYQFSLFLEEQKYITKRVTFDKIMLKLYASLAAGEQAVDLKVKNLQKVAKKQDKIAPVKLNSRPQFLQFIIRLAIQKWCIANPKKKKPVKIQKNFQDDILQFKKSKKLEPLKVIKPAKIQKKQQLKQQKQKDVPQKAKEQPLMNMNQGKEEQQEGQQQRQMKKFKLQLPLALMDGIQRTLSTLVRYSQNYKSSNWRKRRYLKNDMLIVIKIYAQFLHGLFFKYVQSTPKTSKAKKLHGLLTLQQLRRMMINANVGKIKQEMKLIEQAFLDSKRLQVQDGILQFGINEQEFIQCIARVSEFIWFNPLAAKTADLWSNDASKKHTPLFLKFQALIVQIYTKQYDLQNKKLKKVVEKGIFEMEIELIIQKIQDRCYQGESYGLLRKNSIEAEEQITLKEVIDELRIKYDKMVIRRQDEQEYDEIE